jgi:hypothetical protein
MHIEYLTESLRALGETFSRCTCGEEDDACATKAVFSDHCFDRDPTQCQHHDGGRSDESIEAVIKSHCCRRNHQADRASHADGGRVVV